METPYLNAEIARLELEQKHNLLDNLQKSRLDEFKAIKEALSLSVVSGCFSADDMEEAYNDGAGINKPREFDIENYR